MTTRIFKHPVFLLIALLLYVGFDLAAQSMVYLDVFQLSPDFSLLSRMIRHPHISLFVIVFHIAMMVLAARGQDESRNWIAVSVGAIHLWFAWGQTPFSLQPNFWFQALYAFPGALWGIFAGAMYYWLVGAFMEALAEGEATDTLQTELDTLRTEVSGLRTSLSEKETILDSLRTHLQSERTTSSNLRTDLENSRTQCEEARTQSGLLTHALDWIIETQNWSSNPDSVAKALRREKKRFEENHMSDGEKARSQLKQLALGRRLEVSVND